MKKSIQILLLSIVFIGSLIFLYFESNKPKEEYKGKVLNYCEVCQDQFQDSIVEIEGNINIPNNTMAIAGNYQLLLDSNCEKISGIRQAIISIGSSDDPSENEMKSLEETFANVDFIIIDNNKKEIKLGDKVKITGKVSLDKYSCQVSVLKIEKLN